ncbi:MAG: hypothetical protein H7A23_21995 [Leptospiraceae bacterium]|nr:hypothetical protein [Leptospiraceae bacterium]
MEKFLIAGGASTTLPSASDALNTAEIYDPTAKTFTLTGNMQSIEFIIRLRF